MDIELGYLPASPGRTDFNIGVIGAGFIMREMHLRSYHNAGFNIVAIASRTPEIAREVADLHGIPRVYDTVGEMLADPLVEIVDIAVPPDQQLGIIRQVVCHHSHIRGILAQKP